MLIVGERVCVELGCLLEALEALGSCLNFQQMKSREVDGQSFAYTYDNIGNRVSSMRENEETDYTANNLNQYKL